MLALVAVDEHGLIAGVRDEAQDLGHVLVWDALTVGLFVGGHGDAVVLDGGVEEEAGRWAVEGGGDEGAVVRGMVSRMFRKVASVVG